MNDLLFAASELVRLHALRVKYLDGGISMCLPYLRVTVELSDFLRAFAGRTVDVTSTGYAICIDGVDVVAWTEKPIASSTTVLP